MAAHEKVSLFRRLGLVGVVAMICFAGVGVAAPVASASCTNGYSDGVQNFYGAGGDANGTRSNLQGSSTLSSCGFAEASVEDEDPNSTAYIQTGYLKETSNGQLYNCGVASTGIFTEYLVYGGLHHCSIYESTSTFAPGASFSVEHNSSGWMSFTGGVAELPNRITSLGFCCGYVLTTGEVSWLSNYPTFLVTYGTTGTNPWAYMTPTSGYTTINSGTGSQSDSEDSDNDWNIGDSTASPPSPFYFQWVG